MSLLQRFIEKDDSYPRQDRLVEVNFLAFSTTFTTVGGTTAIWAFPIALTVGAFLRALTPGAYISPFTH